MAVTIQEIVEKRKRIWGEHRDPFYDRKFCAASVRKILSAERLRKEIYERPYLLMEVAFTVVDKKGKTVPFFLNEVQRDFIHALETKGTHKPFLILKGRQQGFTTLITAIQLSFAIVRKNFSGFTVANSKDNATAIFNDSINDENMKTQLQPLYDQIMRDTVKGEMENFSGSLADFENSYGSYISGVDRANYQGIYDAKRNELYENERPITGSLTGDSNNHSKSYSIGDNVKVTIDGVEYKVEFGDQQADKPGRDKA